MTIGKNPPFSGGINQVPGCINTMAALILRSGQFLVSIAFNVRGMEQERRKFLRQPAVYRKDSRGHFQRRGRIS